MCSVTSVFYEYGSTRSLVALFVDNKAVQQCRWLEEVNSNLKPGTLSSIDVNVVRRLIQTGVAVTSHRSCERAMSELQHLLTASDTCEQKALRCLKARSEIRVYMHPWKSFKVLEFLTLPSPPLNSRPWKYLKTGQVLESLWISFHRSLKVLEFTNSYCVIWGATSLNRCFAWDVSRDKELFKFWK